MLGLTDIMDRVFLKSGFQEPVVYTPSGSPSISISAVVFRNLEGSLDFKTKMGVEAARKYKIEIYVSITDVPIVKVNADRVQFKRFPQDSAASIFKVAGIVSADSGSYRLGLI
jgi:hypothetical protein